VQSTDATEQTAAAADISTTPAGTLTSIVLLTDRDGHVGRVDLVTPGSRSTVANLAKAGQVAATDGRSASSGHLSDAAEDQLANAARDLADPDAARQAEGKSREVLNALQSSIVPAAANLPRSNTADNSSLVSDVVEVE